MRLHVAEPRYISEGISRMSKITQRFFSFQESFFGYCYRGFVERARMR
jgi:hypothetical protein